jgi:peroxiredoxin Q/BCP
LVDKLADLDTVVFGISTDNAATQGKFVEKESLKISLLADSDKKMSEALGALSSRGFASRYTYVIDKQGIIKKVYTKVSPAAHPEEVATYSKANLKK